MEVESKHLSEDTPKKKRHIVRWIFNILCLLIISLLFLVGVWTRNLNLLWLVVPIALWVAAFKRNFAGWLALGFLACIIGIVVWLFLPDSGNWRPYTFDYELKDLEAKRAVPDAENAAIAYQKIIARLDVNNAPPFYDGGKHNECNEPSTRIFWKGSDHPETSAFLDARKDIIAETIAASKMEKCTFPLLTNPMMPMDTISGIRRLAYLVVSAANRDMGEGRFDEALEKYNGLLHLGRQLEHQTTLIQLLVGEAIETLAYRQLSSAIIDSNLNGAPLDYIQKRHLTTADDWPKLYLETAANEILLGKNLFGMMLYEINDEGTVRFRRGAMSFAGKVSQALKSNPASPPKSQKLDAIVSWFIYPDDPKTLSKIYDEEFERSRKLFDANKLETEQMGFGFYLKWMTNPYRYNFRMMTQMPLSAQAKFQETHLRMVAYRRTTHILLALREYKDANGQWPESLDQIKDKIPVEAMIDPFTCGSFIYKTKGDKFLLYSIGANKIDEKCVRQPKGKTREEMESKFDDILIWPQKYEEAKEFFDANTPAVK